SVLHAMTKASIQSADVNRRGTQLKLTLKVNDGQRIIFKPKWYSRETIFTDGPFEGWDRHNGEVAAFHIGRLLEFNRTPLVIGRRINLRTEILPYATSRLKNTFFTRGNNTCFYGMCHYCRGESTGVCGDGDIMEGVVMLWLPSTYELFNHNHPWKRTYREYKASFGNPFKDEESILAPLYQCCRIRFRTWQRLLILQDGVLSEVLRKILNQDPISPVLWKYHYGALDRRLKGILAQVQVCIDRNGLDTVLVKDDQIS
ncbi:glycosaminoglycan xylosylkinase-like, partial [Ylistrum balloti]|uniref:glycosaminoglycan xylosylkinase-like n=1 Tax=Ylistrum balloti TaxID=509963 RepID=UPI0029059191